MNKRRSRSDIVKAVRRVSREETVHISALTEEADASERAILRWIVQGRRGKYMDGFHKPGEGWMSSKAALARFLAVPLCPECGTQCIECEAGEPARVVVICPACPIPFELVEPVCRQPLMSAA
jgi:hypothetical protein